MCFGMARKATGWMVLDVDGGQVAAVRYPQPEQTSYEEVSRLESRPDLGGDRTLPGRLVIRCGIAVGLTSKSLTALVVAAALFTTGCGSSAPPADSAPGPVPVLPVSAALSTVSAAPSTLMADGTRTTVITVTARDTAGAAYAGRSVVLGASGAGNTITQPAAPTGTNGETTGTIASTQVGQKTVTATVDGVLLNQQATVSFIPALTISPANPTLFTDWLTFSASGGSAAGYTWAFVTNPSGGSINPTSGRYVPGVTTGVTDVIKVTDSLGNTVTASITISPPTFFVTRGSARAVVKLDASGAVVGTNPFATLASAMDYGTAVDLSGNLFFPTLGGGTIEKVTPGGAVSVFATTGGLLEGAARNPLTGDIFATNFVGNNLKRIDVAGAVTDVSPAGIANPVGIVFDLDGNYYITSFASTSVRAFKPDGTALTTWGTNGVVSMPAGATAGIAFDPREGYLYVSCQNVRQVYRINSTGTTVTLFWTAPSGQTNGLAVGDGSLYVANRGDGVVHRVDLVTATATLFATIPNAAGITRIP